MNVIDHAILIPASPAFIWRFLGDMSCNMRWQKDCNDISFVTTQHQGRGTRWRYATPKGKDVIVEITAWYDTVGYEYRIVEGTAVSENQGRIRLQEIAEGTLVQWTFNYRTDGMLAGLRNSITLKRTLTNNIQDSLRDLYKLIQQETGGISTHEARSIMKDAPDVEEREKYQPRHPTNFKEDTIPDTFTDSGFPSEAEAPYQPADATPEDPDNINTIIESSDDTPPVDFSNPLLINQIQEPPILDDDTKPNAPITPVKPIETIVPTAPEPLPQQQSEPEPVETITNIRDTSRISVFDVFGLQKPSETQEIPAVPSQSTIDTIHVDTNGTPAPPDASHTITDEHEAPQVADVPEVVAPESIAKEVVNAPESLQHHGINIPKLIGLRAAKRQQVIKLRKRQ
jgi:hypothetical protein